MSNQIYNIDDFGAIGDNKTDNTKAIQAVIFIHTPQVSECLISSAEKTQF